MEALVQGAELGDDGELVFFLGESDQRTSEDPVIVQYHLERAPVNLMRPAVKIQVCVEVVLRHFQRSRYRSGPLWFFYGEGI
jgi:hypothetical protein